MIMRLLGLALIAYGPALALFFLSVSRSGQMVVLMMAGAFFWILSILLSSAIWYGVQQQTGRSYTAVSITVAIVCQEAFRFLFWILLRRAEPGLNQVSDYPKSKLNRLRYAFVGGLGFGLMSGLVNFITQLSESNGAGMIPCNSCPSEDMFFVSAVTTSFFVMMHTLWGVILFDGLHRNSMVSVIWVVGSHFAASFGTTLIPSSSVSGGCYFSFAINFGVLAGSCGLAFLPLRAAATGR